MTPSAQHLEPLAIDAANGVGAMKLACVRQTLAKFIQIDIFNDGTKGRLNEKVKRKKATKNFFENFSLNLVWC
jgi:hypothetical protein